MQSRTPDYDFKTVNNTKNITVALYIQTSGIPSKGSKN